MRGEKAIVLHTPSRRMGSPPRARGEAALVTSGAGWWGITPACAGRSLRESSTGFCSQDHPRVRGEKCDLQHESAVGRGSPPRARGEVSQGNGRVVGGGITPACAGRSISDIIYIRCNRDHPRVRGEKALELLGKHLGMGSPPRARGEVEERKAELTAIGITPACAGRSESPAAVLKFSRDHPRVRGEKYCQPPAAPSYRGSPPRARGEGVSQLEQLIALRITPACAGRSLRSA